MLFNLFKLERRLSYDFDAGSEKILAHLWLEVGTQEDCQGEEDLEDLHEHVVLTAEVNLAKLD